MPILNDGKTYYPLEFGRMVKDGKVYYDRSAREKSYFYLAMSGTWRVGFIPAGSTGLLTAGGKKFRVREK